VKTVVFVNIETRNIYRNLSYLRKVDYLGDPCRCGKITLRWILEKQDVRVQIELNCFWAGSVVGFCDCGDKV